MNFKWHNNSFNFRIICDIIKNKNRGGNMLELFISPGKYVSGYDNIDKLGQEVEKLGKKPMVLFDKNIEKIIDSLESGEEGIEEE